MSKYQFESPFSSAMNAEQALKTQGPSFWEKRGEAAALRLFHTAAERVPAYTHFLRKNSIIHTQITTIADFKKEVPLVDKNNYLRQYSLSELSWDGALQESWQIYAATSGSTGEPFYFPRSEKHTEMYALLAELYLRNQFKIHEKSTLYVDSFAMGAWIGGLFTYQAIEKIASKNEYKLHIITPGINKEGTLKAIKKLSPLYDQTIIGGYPPFTRDLVEEGIREGIDWGTYNLKFVFSAEGFGERFREHIVEHAQLTNTYLDMVNHYGTVDQGTLAYETSLCIFMRKQALANKQLYKALFSEPTRLPTLAQYLPEHFYFEVTDSKNIVCTSDSGLPLIRYDLKDHGGIQTFEEGWDALSASLPTLTEELTRTGIDTTIFKLPFVHVYERSDFSVVLYGANVYPEHVRLALEHKSLSGSVTGKCVLQLHETKKVEPQLAIYVELKKGSIPSSELKKAVRAEIVSTLLEHNSEYRSNYAQLPKKVTPKIILCSFGDSTYFGGKGKQKWVLK